MVGLEFTGASSGTAERQWTELLSDGGVAGALRRGSRELECRVMLLAANAEALSWGKAWLASTLRGSHCQTGCSGDQLCVYAACPEPRMVPDPDAPDPSPEDCSGAGGLMPEPGWTPVSGGDRVQRTLFDVSLIEGPTLEQERQVTGGWTAEMTFTLKAGSPHFYRIPELVYSAQDGPPPYRDVLDNYDIMASAMCPAPVDCMDSSPYCGPGSSPWGDEPFPGSDPNNPGVLLDPCFPTAPFRAQRGVLPVPRGLTPGWLEKVPIITVHSGSQELRRVTVRFYTNPQGLPPGPELDPCQACTEVTIPWIPARTIITLDGRTRDVLVNCDDAGQTTTSATLYGPRGDEFSWPVFECATPLFVEVLALQASISPDMWYTLEFAARQDVI
ncbi:hypothetical protein FHX42_005317 [Saccharopolyspora lacisalsi]|uniref:Uncharacterized protein n=1 Tax=Halosaccharopolyspora lacisalsi TaxID=1000566 RepID=A0A839E4E6_9PSEU|nr:hypothetical protein [Halosaccharopolyspora lacisalsi]MBA8827910.1 hypothetical protein [Halosaccharopolyspora lacisalsi]